MATPQLIMTAEATRDEFWKKYLVDASPSNFPNLADDTTDENDISTFGHALIEPVDADFAINLHKFCEEQTVEPEAVFAAAWALTLRTYTGSGAITFATFKITCSKRSAGIYASNFEDGQPLLDLVRGIQRDLNQNVPQFATSLFAIKPSRDEDGRQICNTGLMYSPCGKVKKNFQQEVDILLNIESSEGTANGSLLFSHAILTTTQAMNVADTVSQIISQILAYPMKTFAEIDLMHPRNSHCIFNWNRNVPEGVTECVGGLLARQVQARPTNMAVHSSDESFTYEQLHALSSRLASHLQHRGVGPEVVVLLCFPKSAWAVVSMMAVIQAGGTILFFDASHPMARLQEIQSQVNSKIMLTAPQYSDMWGWSSAEVIIVDHSSLASLPPQETIIKSTVMPSNMLYIIFTSGSTGKPKGCVVEHRQFLTGALAQQRESGMVHTDRVLQLASFTFDVSILEIVTSLITGACVCIPGDESRAKGPASCIEEFGVTWAFLTPSLVRLMNPQMVPNLRFLVLGGEPLAKDNVDIWAPHLQLANGYGPTECSIAATGNKRLGTNTHPQNIGSGLGAVCWVVDPENQRLLPIGAPGELLVDGPIVARGYFHNETKTNEVFIDNLPWLGTNTRRMYKTGDLARYNSDGTIHFIGRIDNQVKLRGLRIELGEIEHHIAVHPLVSQAVVLLPRQGPCANQLTAMVALKKFHESDKNIVELLSEVDAKTISVPMDIIAEDLSSHIPGYMMPTVWAAVKSIPLTTSSKQNRKSVERWVLDMSDDVYRSIANLDGAEDSPEPSSEMELKLHEFCVSVLGVPKIRLRMDRSFVNNGGDSILGMQLMARLRSEGVDVNIQDMLQSKTLFELADRLLKKTKVPNTVYEIQYDVEELKEKTLGSLHLGLEQIEEAYPLSPMQRGILLAQQMQSDSYELRIACQVIPPSGYKPDPKKLITAWQGVVSRHSSLRTIFVNSIAEQGLYDQVVLKFPETDVSEVQCIDGNDFFRAVRTRKRSFSATRPPVSFIVGKTATGDLYCAVSMSHALLDGVSALLLFQDLGLAYSDLLAPEVMKYSSYIGYLQSKNTAESLAYWQRYLADLAPCHFPLLNDDFSGPKELQELRMELDDPSQLISFCRQHNLTPSSVFQAAWALVLRTYTSSDDVCFGFLSSGRDVPLAGVTDTIGVYINMLLCRMKLTSENTALTIAEAAQVAFVDSLAHQHCSLAEIQNALQINEPFFNTIMSLQSAPGEVIKGTDNDDSIGFQIVDEYDPTEYNISVNIAVSKQSIHINMRHYTSILSGEMAKNVFDTFKTAIYCVLNQAESTITDLRLLSERDEKQIHTWNKEAWEDVHTCIHEEISKQVSLRSMAHAIEAWDGTLTYSELEHLTTDFARSLVALGVGPEILVPLCFNKSMFTVLAQLSVLKAGGACVAFDPEHPHIRRQELISQCGARLAIVMPQYKSLFEGLVDTIVVVDKSTFGQPNANGYAKSSLPLVASSNPAFVVFTSGSTGKPKGIVLEHHALVTSARAHGPAMNYGPDARVLQFASYTFDVSIGETFTCLMSGGTLCIPHEDERMNDLAGVINRMEVNVAYLTPSVAGLLHPSEVPGLHTLALGGEAVRADNIALWADKLHLVNIYGPAECSVWSTGLTPVPPGTSATNIGVGLGALMWITEVGNYNKLAAIGRAGELLIEGPIIARGYLKDSEKTNAVFVSDPAWLPFDSAIGSRRMYRTGDLARFNSDGSVNFIGRKDNQLKLHGQRIEMGEIDYHLLGNETIRNAVVVYPKTGTSQGKLVAVICLRFYAAPSDRKMEIKTVNGSKEGVAEQVSVVQDYLSDRVPGYMVPAAWVVVEDIPLSVNGKTDRSRITKWVETFDVSSAQVGSVTRAAIAAPVSEVEVGLSSVIGVVLNIPADQISMEQSFLSLGGDSITAMQVSARSRGKSIAVSVKDILRSKTIRHIAQAARNFEARTELANGDIRDGPFQLLSNPDLQHMEVFAKSLGLAGISDIEDAYPCSPMQQGILISQAHAPTAYKFHVICEVLTTDATSKFDIERFKVAWERVVNRHPSLRTVFVEGDSDKGLFDQVVLRKFQPRIDEVPNFTTLKQYQEIVPVNYEEKIPPHRLTLCSENGRTYFNLEISHTLIDGASMAIILRDMVNAYEHEVTVGPRYRDYIAILQQQSPEQSLSYWKTYLSGVEPSTFPQLSDGPENIRELETIQVSIPEFDVRMLHQFSHDNGVTLANIFQLAWGLVLRAFTSSPNVLFGYLASGRDIQVPDIENAVGPFINMLVCRVDVENATPVIEAVQQIQDDFLQALPHQHTPLAEIQHAIEFSGKRLFNTILSLQRPMAEGIREGSELSIKPLGGLDPTEYDLGVNIVANDKTVEASLSYWSTFLSKERAEMVASTFTTILSNMVKKSSSLIGEIDFLAPECRDQIFKWNNEGKAPEMIDACIHDLFSHHKTLRPDAPAICSWDGEYTFAELNDLADRLSHQLVSLGVGPEVKVPLCFNKSAWAVITMLAVLKAGGAYVSMNPTHPKQHLANIINETNAALVLVGSLEFANNVAEATEQVLVVNQALLETLTEISPNTATKAVPSNAAFVCFTSGSTGKPKGIVLRHSGFCSMVRHHYDVGINSNSRVFQFSAYTFDTSNMEIFFPLISGGCVCIPSEQDRLDDPAGAMTRMRVNWTFMTPSMASILSPQDVPTLKLIALGGEQVREDIVSRWSNYVIVLNTYGPAECTIASSLHHLKPGTLPSTIGQGRGCLFWIADSIDDQRLAPIGCIGELLIDGPNVSRGYLDPEKTRQAFIKAPRWRGPTSNSTTLYKTGDLVKYGTDGMLIYVGRRDGQIKLNGQRIEMSEIERHIASNSLVRHAVVLYPKSGLCKRKLVVVVAPKNFTSASTIEPNVRVIKDKVERSKAEQQVAEVKTQLLTQVPAYMVPSIWLTAESCPLTASKKVDRVKISNWVQDLDDETFAIASNIEEDELNSENATPREEHLQQLISRVLGLPVEQVGLQKSFLNLGGDSILAMQLIVQCRREGLKITVKDVMRSKTISALALSAETISSTALSKEENFDEPFDLSPIQQMYMNDISRGSIDRRENQFNQSFLLRLMRHIEPENMAKAIESVVQRHSMLRGRFRKDETGKWSQITLRQTPGSYLYQTIDVKSREEALVMAAESQESLDIENGPVFSVQLLNISRTDQCLFLVAHHLIIDLVSWRVMLRDLEEILLAGTALSNSTPLPFQNWTKLQAEYAAKNLEPTTVLLHSVPEADYSFWGMELTPNLRADVEEIAFTLDQTETMTLLTGCHTSLNTEPLDVLLSALFYSFTHVFKRKSPAVFNEGHGREPWDSQIDVSETVGWFTTMFPLSSSAEDQSNILDIIRSIKDQRRQLPRNGWAYFTSRYLQDAGKEAFAKHSPVEIVFNYLGLYQGMEREDSLFRIEPFNKGDVGPKVRRTSLFDINVYVLDGIARFSFTFNKKMKHQAQIRHWTESYKKMIPEVCKALQSAENSWTLSDFPLSDITYPALQKLQKKILPELGIAKSNLEDLYACSPMQEGILLSQGRLDGTYQVQTIVEVTSSTGVQIDLLRLQNAWQRVIDRHPSLRTVFIQQLGSRPFDQLVLRNHQNESSVVYCGDTFVIQKLKELSDQPFAIGQPPHRFTVAKSNEGRAYCMLDISHALTDGTSMSILISELALAYEGKFPVGSGPLYSDYISYIQSQPPGKALKFWTEHLAEVKVCQFPTLLDNKIESEKQQHNVHVEMPDPTQIRAFCQENSVTLANIFRLAWGLVLRTYTGDQQVCFGYLASGRELPVSGIDSAVGAFINMLVCSLDFVQMDSKATVDGLEGLQDEYLKVLPWQYASLAEIQHELGLSGQTLFNTVLSFQKRSLGSLGFGDISFKFLSGEDPTEFDIAVNIADSNDGLHVELSYSTSRISDGQAANVAGALSAAVSSIIGAPTSNIGNLSLFGQHDRQQISQWNKDCPSVINECVHEIFSKNARKYPDAPAITSWDANFTYAELDEKVNQLAQTLVSFGVGPDVLVPICFPKSSYALISMLGIMKAGGGFVPLDPAHPKDRLQTIIRQIGARVALVSPETTELILGLIPEQIVISASSSIWQLSVSHDLASIVMPNNLAYTLFTSGSTGTPKGVSLEHSAVSSSIIHHGAEIGCSRATRMYQFAAYTFDACILEIFTALAYGGCICIPSDAERMSDIAGSMTRMKANTSFMTPSLIRIIEPDQVPTLQTLILGGEALGKDNISTWADKLRLMNGYGPTETCVFCVMKTFETKDDRHDVLGKAVSSISWIVRPEDHSQLAPVGSVGLLLVQGPTLARGYLNDSAKTAAAFIEGASFLPNVAGVSPRLYNTGDLARYNSDGSINYLGRRDTQVKLRGQRIELAEIESQTKINFPAATQIGVEVVIPRGDKAKATLAAFLCLEDRPQDDAVFIQLDLSLKDQFNKLQSALTAVLPPYMVPSMYFPLCRMPTTTAGKLDRKALRHSAAQLSDSDLIAYSLLEGTKRAPHTEMEKKLAFLWHEVLKLPLEHIGADDSFFRLGGDSIVAMRLSAMSTAQLSISVAEIFRYPKLAEMAAVAGKTVIQDITPDIAPFELVKTCMTTDELKESVASKCGMMISNIEDAYPSTPLQEGLLALSIIRPGAYMAQKVFALPETMNLQRFKDAWQRTIQQHPILRTSIVQAESDGALQVVSKTPSGWRTASSLKKYLARDNEESVTYGQPLSRFAITKDNHFIWTAHHAIYDGWMVPLILEQVKNAYENGPTLQSPAFNTFIEYLGRTNLEASAEYWSNQLSGERPVAFPELPSASHKLLVDQKSHHKIQISRKPGSEFLMATILRAAWAIVLANYSDARDVVFGVTLSGRNCSVAGIDKMLGPTITTVPLRLRLDQEQTVVQFLESVQTQATEMIPHEHFGLQNIARLSQEAARAVEFGNLFVVQPLAQFDIHGHELLGATEVPVSMENFDTYPLIMECSLSDDQVELETRYDGSIIAKDQMKWMLHHFEHVVRQLSDGDGSLPMAKFEMFSNKDKSQILEWNNEYPEVLETCVPKVFAEQVKIRPNAFAVNAWDGDFTYRELDNLSTKLAYHLVTNFGVGSEVLVPLCFDKSRWAVVAQMAIMKAGGGCVNLDPAHPLGRLELIIQDSRAKVILAAPQHATIFGDVGPAVLTIEEGLFDILPVSNATKLPTIRHTDTAYVLFTSGSTGKPKGIVIEHGSLCTSSEAHGTRWDIGPNTRLLQFAAYTFDVSCADIHTTLQRGGCICIPSDHDRLNDLAGAINRFRCNWAFLTPTVASLLPAKGIPTLKKLVLGGEASTRDTIAKWHNVLDLIVCYGPAECSVYCSGAPPATATSDPADLGPAIGALYWIADPANHNRLVPVGCVGELLLEGRTVAREYLHDEAKTAGAFIKNPSWATGGTDKQPRRFYKTGDLVRYNSDGTIHFVGRKDTQVKIRGQRVELGEIEHALRNAMPEIAHVTVDAIRLESQGGRQSVVAFLHTTTNSGSAKAISMDQKWRSRLIPLQRSLSETLPSYMIPSMFIPMAQVPLTMNGKADRRQLRELAASFSREQALVYSLEDSVKATPTTEMEFNLRRLWAHTLGMNDAEIGTGDNFFRLGGDSILAMKLVVAAVEKGIALSVKDFFKTPILADMAAFASDRAEFIASGTPAYQPFSLLDVPSVPKAIATIASQLGTTKDNITDILPATDFQQNAVAHALLKTRGFLNYLLLDSDDCQPLEIELAKEGCLALVNQHQILRTVFAAHEDKFLQVVLRNPDILVETYEIDEDVTQFSVNLCKKDIAMPYRLADPFVKFMIVSQRGGSQRRIIMRISHAQYDGVCLPRVWRTMEEGFAGRIVKDEETHFSTYVSAAATVNNDEARQYWSNLLHGSAMSELVPQGKPSYRNIYNQAFKRTIPTVSLSEDGITFATLLKAAWATVLSSIPTFGNKNTDLVFGHVTSGRNIDGTDLDKVVGPCLNIIPVRITLDANKTNLELMQEVQDQHAASMSYESLGSRDIIRKCTSWPNYTRFSSIVQHQNIDEDYTLTLAGSEYTIGNFCPEADEADVAIKSTPLGDTIEVALISSSRSVGPEMAKTLLDRLCWAIQYLASDPSGHNKIPTTLARQPSQPRINTRRRTGSPNGINDYLGSVKSRINGWENIEKKTMLLTHVKDAWQRVLRYKLSKVREDSDFFAIGGDLVAVAVLAATWQQEGYRISVEDLIDCSELGGMVDVLVRTV